MNQYQKSLLMIVAMLFGALCYSPVVAVDAFTGQRLAPALLFAMLYITFCGVDLRDLKFSMVHLWIVLFQIVTAVGSYYLALPLGEIVAQGVMICFIMPVAAAAVVIGKLLGGKVINIASFSIVCNVILALFIPIFFTHIGGEGCSFWLIASRVAPLMILPPILTQIMHYVTPSITGWFGARGFITYYIWLLSLIVNVSRTTSFVVANLDDITLFMGVALSLGALISCVIQYRVGRIFGIRYGDPAGCEQSLGQKNTILGIWMAQTFLSPIASIAPTSYVIWQNLMNSYKLFKHQQSKK